jgi:hypothetical protein
MIRHCWLRPSKISSPSAWRSTGCSTPVYWGSSWSSNSRWATARILCSEKKSPVRRRPISPAFVRAVHRLHLDVSKRHIERSDRRTVQQIFKAVTAWAESNLDDHHSNDRFRAGILAPCRSGVGPREAPVAKMPQHGIYSVFLASLLPSFRLKICHQPCRMNRNPPPTSSTVTPKVRTPGQCNDMLEETNPSATSTPATKKAASPVQEAFAAFPRSAGTLK